MARKNQLFIRRPHACGGAQGRSHTSQLLENTKNFGTLESQFQVIFIIKYLSRSLTLESCTAMFVQIQHYVGLDTPLLYPTFIFKLTLFM